MTSISILDSVGRVPVFVIISDLLILLLYLCYL